MVKQGFPQQPFSCEAGKESLAFSITLPIPFSGCLKAKYPPNSSLTLVSFGTQEKISEGIYLSEQNRLRDNKTKGKLQYFYIDRRQLPDNSEIT